MKSDSDYDSWFRDEVAKGQAQAARSELIEREVVQRIESHLRDKQSRSK